MWKFLRHPWSMLFYTGGRTVEEHDTVRKYCFPDMFPCSHKEPLRSMLFYTRGRAVEEHDTVRKYCFPDMFSCSHKEPLRLTICCPHCHLLLQGILDTSKSRFVLVPRDIKPCSSNQGLGSTLLMKRNPSPWLD